MRSIRAGRALALVAGVSLLLSVLVPDVTAVAGLDVTFEPPRLVLRAEPVTLTAFVEAPYVTGTAYVRGGPSGPFSPLPMTWSTGQRLVAKVPARLLKGSVLESYVVVRVPGTSQSVTAPQAGKTEPARTWILDDPSNVRLPAHQFGKLRSPEAIVAQAGTGSGPGQVGIACPSQGRCAEPTSFDVEADGTVWVADPANHRLLVWEPGAADRPSRSIPLDFTPVELAVAADGSAYVTGVKPGAFDGVRLFVLDPDGRQRGWTALASDIFNSRLRFGSDGVLYHVEPGGPWRPVVDRSGAPIAVADQLSGAQADQPTAGGGRLVVDAPGTLPSDQLAPRDWRAAIVTAGGRVDAAWRIISANDLDLSFEAVATMVDGDPLLVFEVYDFANHIMEHVMVRLSASGGVRDRFSLGRGGYRGGDVVTDVRMGADGRLYQLLSDPAWGLTIARYALKGPAAPNVTPTPTHSPTPTPSPSPTPTLSPGPTPTPSPTAAGSVPSPGSTTPPEPSPSAQVDWALPAVLLGVAALAGGIVAWITWSRRRRPPAGPRPPSDRPIDPSKS